MQYRDNIIEKIADDECERICRKTIRNLQKMKEGKQSGDDTPLINIWDEVCVQVQFQHYESWGIYLETIITILCSEVSGLDNPIKQAIWLQTNSGMYWDCNDEELEKLNEAPYSEDDITDYILHKYVLSKAANWTNDRINKYLRPID